MFPLVRFRSRAPRLAILAALILCIPTGEGNLCAQPGDFNGDGLYDCRDIDSLTAEVAAGTNDQGFDVNGDGLVDIVDRDEWLAIAGSVNLDSGNPYLFGDANLDGQVDVSDFMSWNSNKFTATAAWCSADFTADGLVDVRDLNLWNSNKFTSAGNPTAAWTPTPYDDIARFTYYPSNGLLILDTNGLELFCWTLEGPDAEALLFPSADNFDELTNWVYSHFQAQGKWFSLDLSAVSGVVELARYETGLTQDDFGYVIYGTPDHHIGRSRVDVVAALVPEPATGLVVWMAVPLFGQLLRPARRLM